MASQHVARSRLPSFLCNVDVGKFAHLPYTPDRSKVHFKAVLQCCSSQGTDLERQMGMDGIHVCMHRARAPVKLKGAERPREASVV
eukprot:6283250-Prymnesium_polylepis.1